MFCMASAAEISFLFLTFPSSQWRLYMHNYKNKTYKEENREKKGGTKSITR